MLLLTVSVSAQSPEEKLSAMGVTLPDPTTPLASYVNAVRAGNLLFLAGKGPTDAEGKAITGKVGQDLTTAEANQAARSVAINHIAVLKAELGDLSRVRRIVKVLGMVNSVPGYTEHSKVMNGYSDVMVEVFGEKGKHARSSVGMASLPFNIVVEVEAIVELEDE